MGEDNGGGRGTASRPGRVMLTGAVHLLCLRQAAIATGLKDPAQQQQADPRHTDIQRDTGIRMIADQGDNKGQEHQADYRGHHSAGHFEFPAP